jgi:hypothetical protein
MRNAVGIAASETERGDLNSAAWSDHSRGLPSYEVRALDYSLKAMNAV